MIWDPSLDPEIFRRWCQGWSWREIGRATGLPDSTAWYRAAGFGFHKPDVRGAKDTWTREMDAMLHQLVFEFGLSFADAAKEMGMTKNQLIGRAHRLGWKTKQKSGTTMQQRLEKIDIFPSAGHCLFGIGDPGDDGFHFCGEKVAVDGASYCGPHMIGTHLPENPATRRLFKLPPLVAA